MHKRNIWIVLMCILAFTLVGCGNKPVEMSTKVESSEKDEVESNKEDDTEQENSDTSDDTTEQENESTSNTQKPDTGNTSNSNSTTKPSTGNNGNSGSTNSGNTSSAGNTNNSGSNNTSNTGSTNTTTTPSEPVHEHTWTEVVEDEIHYYAWRTICGKCKTDMTDMTDDEAVYHSAITCRSGYSTHYIEVDFVTENIQKETIVTGYKCECGATKK